MAVGLRSDFLLDPSVTFLNHGSFGACPKPVFESYQNWQLELERQPVEFLGRNYHDLLRESREALAGYLNAPADDLVYTDNATMGVNIVAKSLDLQPGDEIVTTDHEYGACNLTWEYLHGHHGVNIKHARLLLPLETPEQVTDSIFALVTDKTKVIYLSHITSFSALIFPVAEICRRAREAGIMTVIDGAHVPGQIPLDLTAVGADFYTGNLHKWFCAPKGAGFLYVRPEYQEIMQSAIISWGWSGRTANGAPTSQFLSRNEWQGTRDPSSFLAVPAAITYQSDHDWPTVRAACHDLVSETRRRIEDLTDLPAISPDSTDWFSQMATCPIRTDDVYRLKADLYEKYRIEIPTMEWEGRQFVRVSIQAYNTREDVDTLLDALKALL